VTELAAAHAPDGGPGLNMRLRLSIPVFVAPIGRPAAADIAVENVASAEDGTHLTLHNTGNAHAKIERIDVNNDGEWSTLPLEQLSSLRYLLPDARARIALPDQRVTAIRIKAEDGGEWEHAVSALP
jgi:P pilus assembly chaperone PapD